MVRGVEVDERLVVEEVPPGSVLKLHEDSTSARSRTEKHTDDGRQGGRLSPTVADRVGGGTRCVGEGEGGVIGDETWGKRSAQSRGVAMREESENGG
jgi:hypothetical protein